MLHDALEEYCVEEVHLVVGYQENFGKNVESKTGLQVYRAFREFTKVGIGHQSFTAEVYYDFTRLIII